MGIWSHLYGFCNQYYTLRTLLCLMSRSSIDTEVVKNTCCYCKGISSDSQIRELTTACKASSRRWNTLFWLSRVLETELREHIVHKYASIKLYYTKTLTENLKKKNTKSLQTLGLESGTQKS